MKSSKFNTKKSTPKNLKCNQLAAEYVKKLGKDDSKFILNELHHNDIINILTNILDDVDNFLTKKTYSSLQVAIQHIPTDSEVLINLIGLYNVYLDNCPKTVYIQHLKDFMCANQKLICKIYHVLHAWALIELECIYFNNNVDLSKAKNISIKNLVNYHIDMTKSGNCVASDLINNTLIKAPKLQSAHGLLTCAYHLRTNFKKYCNKKMDKVHRKFYEKIGTTITDLETIMTQKHIPYRPTHIIV